MLLRPCLPNWSRGRETPSRVLALSRAGRVHKTARTGFEPEKCVFWTNWWLNDAVGGDLKLCSTYLLLRGDVFSTETAVPGIGSQAQSVLVCFGRDEWFLAVFMRGSNSRRAKTICPSLEASPALPTQLVTRARDSQSGPGPQSCGAHPQNGSNWIRTRKVRLLDQLVAE